MNRRLLLAVASCLVGTSLVGPASAHEYVLGPLEIGHPWARPTPPGAPTGAAYLTVENSGSAPDRLLGASTAVAGEAQVHEMSMVEGVMRMAELAEGLPIPASTTVALEPGGYHIMLIGLKEPLVEGTKVPLTLTFEVAGSIEVELAVEKKDAEDMHGDHAQTGG